VISVGLELLHALDVVHEAGLLHLDIKPSNVLMTLDGGLVLLDFDAAQPWAELQHEAPAGSRSRPAFTPGFSAPEALACETSQGPWTDVYAVGACLYACMLGHPPQDALGRAASDSVPGSLNALADAYSVGLRTAVLQALSLGADARQQRAEAFALELLQAAKSHGSKRVV
jgi:serine/threonine protein kinase